MSVALCLREYYKFFQMDWKIYEFLIKLLQIFMRFIKISIIQ